MNLLNEIKDKGKKVTENKFVYYIFEDPRQILNTLVFNKYLLHGSSKKIVGQLIPHQANDLAKEFGNQKAIYMTSDPIGAMYAALTGGVEGIGKSICRKNTSKDNEGKIVYKNTYFAVSNPNKIKDKGYVYIFLKSDADENEHYEFIAKKAIEPKLIIEIKREDFPFNIVKLTE
jgi:hypothetical protein